MTKQDLSEFFMIQRRCYLEASKRNNTTSMLAGYLGLPREKIKNWCDGKGLEGTITVLNAMERCGFELKIKPSKF